MFAMLPVAWAPGFPTTEHGMEKGRAGQAERLAELASLAGGLVHEIRNRLNAICFDLHNVQYALAGLVAATGANGETATLLQDIAGEVDWQEGIMREFLRLARPEPPQIEAVRVGELLDSVLRLVEGPFRSQNVELSWDCPPEVSVASDPKQLRQVLLNLVRNAQQAMPQAGRIRLRGHLGRHHAVLEVADDGPGIPEEVRAKIFQPFFSTKEAGTGLGLSICQRLVQQMNGRLGFQTELGRGTTFVVRLPRAHRGHGYGQDSSRRRRRA